MESVWSATNNYPKLPSKESSIYSRPEYLYLELLKLSVTNFIYRDDQSLNDGEFIKDLDTGKLIGKPENTSLQSLLCGMVWPSKAHTMIGIPRLNNIHACALEIINRNIPGDFIETGVWRGGACIFMRGFLKAYNITNRNVWVADSFQGLPKAQSIQDNSTIEWWKYKDLAIPMEQVQSNFKLYNLLDNQVKFLKGWFKDTLPTAPIQHIALLRLDGDMYESTMDALIHLYPKLSPGGYIIIDDYYAVKECKQAVHDYRQQYNINSTIWNVPQDRIAVFWEKE